MPLLEVVQTRYISASVRLTDATALQVDQYAAFIHASADEVMEQALAYVFSKDRDFQEFLKSPEARRITPTLRVRRVPAIEAAEPAAKEHYRWSNRVSLRGDRRHESCFRSRTGSTDGASHRENFDTPPLKGSCRYTKVNLHDPKELRGRRYTQVYRLGASEYVFT